VKREDRDEREFTQLLSLDAQYKFPLGAGELVANANVARERTLERIRSADDSGNSLATDRERLWSGVAGSQYRSELGDGQIEALLTQRIGRLRARATQDDESFTEATRTSETIGRVDYRHGSKDFRLFGSMEGALNRLNGDATLIIGGIEVPISGSDVHVTEDRAEAAVGAIWKPSDKLTIEPSMRAELSSIRSTGDSPSRERFLFWKPRFRVDWDHGSGRLQSTIEREVAQLDFDDFVASAELDRDDVVAGATSLLRRVWRGQRDGPRRPCHALHECTMRQRNLSAPRPGHHRAGDGPGSEPRPARPPGVVARGPVLHHRGLRRTRRESRRCRAARWTR
jgi:hypothetical protein